MQRTSTYAEAHHEGWMTKKGKIRRNWQRRWFILEDGQLKYYKAKITETQKGKVKPTGVILIGGCEFGPTATIGSKYENCFQLVTTTRTYYMYTETPAEFETWKQKLLAQGAKWNGAVRSRATIREDGSIEEGKDKTSSKNSNNNNNNTESKLQTAEQKSTPVEKPAETTQQPKPEQTQPESTKPTEQKVEPQVEPTQKEHPKSTEPQKVETTPQKSETQSTQQQTTTEPPKAETQQPKPEQTQPESTKPTEQKVELQAEPVQQQQAVSQPTESKPVEPLSTQVVSSQETQNDNAHVHEYDEDDDEEEEEILSELTFDIQLRQEAQYFTPTLEKPSEPTQQAAETKTEDAESEEKEESEEPKESTKLELPTWDPIKEGGYNPLLDGTNQPGIAEAIADLVSLDAQGYMEVGSRQAALLEYFQYINNMKSKESLEMGYEQFANAEVLALIADEFSGKIVDAKWHAFTSAEKPKEDEYVNQLSNHDQILAFMNDTKLFPKKEILPLIRTLISVNAFKGRDSFATTLKDRLLALKKAYDSLAERPSKLSQPETAESKSGLPTVAQVVLTATIDLISSPFVTGLVKSPEASQVAVSVLDTLLNSLRKFPLLSLCVNNKLDKLTLEGVFKLTKWLEELSQVAPSVRQKVMHVLIELTLATGSVELMMSVLAQTLRFSPKEVKEYFPLHGIHERLDQLQTLYIDHQVEGPKADGKMKPSLGVSSRLLGVWENFNIVTTNNVFDNEMLSTQQQLRTIVTDGSYLYIHDSFGLRKIGTGYHGTTKAKLYASLPDYHPLEKLWLVYFNNRLYCSTTDDQVTYLIVLSCDTLQEVETQPLSFPDPQPEETGIEPEDEISKQYVLTSDGFYFYVLRQKSDSSALLVDVYEPNATKGAISSFVHVRRIVPKGKTEDKFTAVSAERFPMGSYITNGRNLMAIVPPAHRQSYISPEECNVYTWDILNGAYLENHIDVEMGSVDPNLSRAFFNTTFDSVNNIIWSYAPYNKKMRLFEPLGLPAFAGAKSLGYPLPVHEFHSIFRHYHIDSSDSVTSAQLATTLVGHAVRLTEAIRPNLEEVTLPTKGPTPYNPSAPYSGITTAEARKKEKQVNLFVPLQVPFAVQPSNQTFAQFHEVLNYLTSVYEEKTDVLREWLLLSCLKLLRANLYAWMAESQNAPTKPKLEKELCNKYSALLKKLLSSKSTRNTLSLVLSEVCESIIIGLDVLYPAPEGQLEALTDLIDSCIQTRTTHVLALRLQSLDLSQWLSESENAGKVTQQLNSFIDKLLSKVDSSTKTYFQERATNPDAKMKDHSSELHILFVYQKQLINTAIKNSQSESIQQSLMQFAAKVVDRSVELIEMLIKQNAQVPVDAVEHSQILQNTVIGSLLPYLVAALPVALSTIPDALKHLSNLLGALDRLNHLRFDLAAQLDKFDTTEPAEKKIGGKTAKLKISPSLPFLLDLERQTAWATGKLASNLVRGPAVSEHEIQFKAILGFEFLVRGISSEFLQNHSKICAAANAGQASEPQVKFLETFIQENQKGGLYATVTTTLNKGRPPASLADEIAVLERTVIAVLLKHLNLVNVAMDQADLITKGQSSKEFPELANVWSKAEKYRKWAVQEAQKMTSNSESESTSTETPVQILTRKARFLLYMVPPEEAKADKPKFSLSDIANKWKQTVKKAQSQQQIEQSQVPEQGGQEKVGWGRFFQIWKAKRQVPVHEEFEKLANEVISFLKDENTNDLNSFCSAVKSQSERAASRIQGFKALQSLLAQVKLPVAKLDIVGNLTIALRKTEPIEQKQLHSVLDNIQTCGQKLTEQTLSGFNEVYSQLKDLVARDDLKPITKLALLDLWNISFEKNEKFILDSSILDILLQVHKATHDKVAKKDSLKSSATPVTRGKEKEQNKDSDGYEALYNNSWLLLRSIFLESIRKKQTDNQATITTSLIQKFYNELQSIVEKTAEKFKQEKPEEEFKQPGIEDEVQQQFIERILVALYSMCQKYSHVHTRHLGTSKWVQLLLNLIRCTSLKSKVISFRLLRLLLPKVELASLKLSVSANQAQGLDLLSFFFQFIGAAYEGSSDNCAETVQSMVFVNTTHDIFAVATEAIMLIRLLINDSAWKSRVLALITESINRLGHLFSGSRDRSRTRSRSRTRTTIAKEMNANWNIIAALCVLGGNRDTLRLGARVTLHDVESEDNEGEDTAAQNLGTVVEFHRMNPTLKVIQDSHKESIKLDINKLAGVVEIAPDLSVVLTPAHLANVVSIIKQKESNEATQTLFFQLRSAVLKILGEILESEDSDKVKEMLINDGFVVPLVELCLTPSQFKSELSIGQLLELSQCLHEVLLSEKETPKCSIAMTTQTSTVNVEQRVQKLVELGYIYEWEINEARLAFSQLDLNGDGVLTPEEVMEASGLNLDEDEAAAFREQLLRADRNKDGTIDFLEFVMMNAGLIDFCFPDENEEDSSKEVPTLQIQRPALIAGSYKLVLKNGQTLPAQPITGDLIDIEEGKEYSKDDIKDTVLLVDTEKVGKSVVEASKDWESKGVLAIVFIGDKVPAELNDDSAIKIPVLVLSPKDANTICSAIGVSSAPSNQNDKPEEVDDSQAVLAEMHLAVMQLMGFEIEQINEAIEKFGIKNLGACIGWLFLNFESQLKAPVPAKGKGEEPEEEKKEMKKEKKGLSLEDLSVQTVEQEENPEEEQLPQQDDEEEPHEDEEQEEELEDEEEDDGQLDLFGGFTAALSGLGLGEEEDEEDEKEGSEHAEESDSEDSDKKDKKDETSEPTYLAKFISSGSSIPVATDQSKSNKKSFIAQFDELDLSNLRGELIRVERAITAHHSRQAIISILSKWPAGRPLTSQSLGVDSTSIIQIFRFAVSMLKSPARLEHLYKVFVPLLEEKDSNLGAQFMQECIGHVIMQSRIPTAAKKNIPRESSNIYFSLAVLQVFLRSQSGLSSYSSLLLKLITELIRSLESATAHLRVAIVNVLTQIMLSIRNNPQPYKVVNAGDLSNSLKIIQSLLQKQFVTDRKKNYAVGSLYLQAVAELVAVGQSMILVLSDLKEKEKENSNTQKMSSLSLLEGLYQERASEKEDEGVRLVAATIQVKMIISDDGCTAKADLGPYDSAFVSVTCSKFITSGKYYYEAVLKREDTGGFFGGGGKMIAQIGWANKKFKANELEGLGVGDDEHSWGYDGGRLRKWHKGKWTAYSKTAWKEDDIVGCAADLDAGKMSFFLNGKLLGEAFSDVTVPEGGICPAATFRNELFFQFNFGKDPFQFPLPGYQSLEPLQADGESGLKLPDFELYCRNFHLINTLYTRSTLSEPIIKYATQRHQKVIQKVSNKIKLKLVSADGKSDTYNVAENILKENHAYYSTEKAKNINIILTSESEFLAKSITLESHRGYGVANPVKNALVFITDEKPEAPQFASYDNFTQEKWDKFIQEKNGQASLPNEPVAYLHIQSGSSAVFKLDTPRKGKFIVLKLLSSSSSSRLDVTHFAVQGQAGPFSPLESQTDSISLAEVKCNNDSWTLDQDAQLVAFCNTVSQRTTTSPLSLSAGQLLSYMTDPQITHAIPILKQVKPEALVFRYYILALFNSELNSFFYWVNLENLKDYSIATKLSHLRSCIFLEVKTKFLDNVLDGIVTATPPVQNLKLNRAKALQQRDGTAPKNDLDTLFGQAFTQLSQANPSLFRALEQAWSVTFLGEGSIDAGGPYRESLSQFCTELQSEALSLLQKSPNGQHNVGFNREMWVPVASAKSNVQISMYEFLGKLFGLALCSSFTLNLDLASMVYKPLVGQQLDINDLKAVDSMCVQSLEALRSIDKQGITEDMFEDVFLEVFTINGSDGKVIELVPGGKDKPVTFQNRFEWAELVEKTRINEFKLQVEAIKRGLSTVIPTPVLGLFSWEELKISIEGKPTLDIALLKEKTVYRAGYSDNSEPVKLFWKVLESLTPEQHGLFLRFTWGRSRLPLYADQFTQEFKISKMYSETPDKTLPLSHTCFFELELPEYSSFDIMKEKLVYAITECQAIDTDFNPTSAANWE